MKKTYITPVVKVVKFEHSESMLIDSIGSDQNVLFGGKYYDETEGEYYTR